MQPPTHSHAQIYNEEVVFADGVAYARRRDFGAGGVPAAALEFVVAKGDSREAFEGVVVVLDRCE